LVENTKVIFAQYCIFLKMHEGIEFGFRLVSRINVYFYNLYS